MIVTIGNKDYELHYTLRGFFVYEEITEKPFSYDKSINAYILMYSMLQACNKELAMNFDEFIDYCDKDITLFRTFTDMLAEQAKRDSDMVQPSSDDKKKMSQSA